MPWTLAIVAAALLVRLIVLVQLGHHPLLQPTGVLDDAVYVKLGERVASGDLAVGPDVYYLAPLYIYFLGLIFALTGGSIAAVRFVQILLGGASVWLVMQSATIWFGRGAGWIAGTLAAFTGLIVFNEILVLQSSLDPFLTSLLLFTLSVALRGDRVGWWLAAGLALGALALNRPNALAALPAILLVRFLTQPSWPALQRGAALALGTLLIVLPITARNRLVAGEWVLVSSHGGLNFFVGNSARADGTWKSVPGIRPDIEGQSADAQAVAGQALGRAVTAKAASDYFYWSAWQWIQSHPAQWVALLARKLALTFSASDAALNYSYAYYARDEATLLTFLVVGPALIIPLGLFGLVVGTPRERWHDYLTWAIFVPAYALTLVAFFVSSRYRLALLIALLTGTGAGVEWLWHHAEMRRVRAATVGIVVLLLLAGASNWPLVVDDGRLQEREERIVQLISDGGMDEGERLLRDTEQRHPAPGLMLYRVGLAFLDRGDATRAIPPLERARTRNPQEASIRLALGEALVDVGRANEAIEHLEVARRANVTPHRTAYDLVRAYQAVNRPDAARRVLASMDVASDTDGGMLADLGATALELQDPVLAERFLRAAIGRAPTLGAAYDRLGVALGLQHRTEDAVTMLEKAAALDPRSATTQFHLALGYAQQGRVREARARIDEALRLRPDYDDARALVARLQTGS